MGRRCCVVGCNSRSSAPEHHGVTYHSFPLDTNIRTVWLKNTRLPQDRNITKSVLVCSRHFRRADFQPMKSGKYLLKQRVFPTVFPWGKLDPVAVAEEVTAPIAAATKADSSAESATSATVEATIAQIMAETAELNASASVKSSETLDGDTSSQLGKRAVAELVSGEEPAPKQARGQMEGSPKVTASPSTKFEQVSVFIPGARLEAQDFDGVWHLARVVEVDNDDLEVLIKFEKAAKNKSATLGSEEWIPMNSSRLRQKVSTKPVPVFELDDKVMARWTGPRRFPGTIKKILENDMYEVLFDDGFVKNVRAIHMNKVLSNTESYTSPDVVKQAAPKVATPGTPLAKPKPTQAVASTSSAHKGKRGASGHRKDWPLLEMKKLDLASLNLPTIPIDGEWTCHWVNDQPIGKEGFLIVGEHKKPTVIVDDWRLPPGWVKHMYQRSNVLGKWDVILVTPNGKRFRSKADLKVYLEDKGQVYNPDIYDFSIHRRRAKDINAYVFTPDYTPQQYKPKSADTSTAAAVTDNQKQTENTPIEEMPTLPTSPTTLDLAAAATLESTSSLKYIEPPEVTLIPPMELMTTPTTPRPASTEEPAVDAITTTPTATPSEDGFAYIGSLKVQIVDNLFRCPQDGCSKNFRKENHLQIHIKHYHHDFNKLLGACPKMQELAEKRTLGTPDSNEPQPKNQIPNQQFFAKLHKQDMEHSRAHRRSTGVSTKKEVVSAGDSILNDETSAANVAESSIAMNASFEDSTAEQNEEAAGLSLDTIAALNKTATDFSQTNTIADSSMLELSVASSTAEECATEPSPAAVLPAKRSRFSQSKRTHGSRKSNRQRTTRRYLTAAQATAGIPLHSVVTTDSIKNGFSAGDFEETRHSFNATPDAKTPDVPIARKRKAPLAALAPATPLSSLDSPVTADSGSSSFLPLTDDLVNSATPLTTPQYIKENGELIKIVQMRQEEIINCLCSYGEEDGLMIQCELCLCWQHGSCNGIEKESDVPDKYVCYICRNPQRGRESLRYKHDQDWLYEGKLPVASYHNTNPDLLNRFDLLKKSHTLTGNLVELKRFMHSLRVKINIANNKDHPKMYLWAKKWDDDDVQADSIAEGEQEEPIKMETESGEDDVTIQMKSEPESDKESQSDLAVDIPSKIKAEPSTPSQVSPAVPNIPQPEAAIEPVECQHRLLEHIKVQQSYVMDRLLQLESEVDDLEKLDTLPDLKNADLSTTKDVLSSFIKELDIMKQIAKINTLENAKRTLNADNSIYLKFRNL